MLDADLIVSIGSRNIRIRGTDSRIRIDIDRFRDALALWRYRGLMRQTARLATGSGVSASLFVRGLRVFRSPSRQT